MPKTSFFCHFLQFGSLVFLEIAQDDSLEQYLTTSRGKTCKKNWGGQIWAKQTKIRSKISFFCHFLKFGSLVFLQIAQDDSLEHCLTTSRGKTCKEKK